MEKETSGCLHHLLHQMIYKRYVDYLFFLGNVIKYKVVPRFRKRHSWNGN